MSLQGLSSTRYHLFIPMCALSKRSSLGWWQFGQPVQVQSWDRDHAFKGQLHPLLATSQIPWTHKLHWVLHVSIPKIFKVLKSMRYYIHAVHVISIYYMYINTFTVAPLFQCIPPKNPFQVIPVFSDLGETSHPSSLRTWIEAPWPLRPSTPCDVSCVPMPSRSCTEWCWKMQVKLGG